MNLRSLLFVPGDSERKLAKVADSDADLVIFDLEDAVLPDRREAARALVATALATPSKPQRGVRINPVDTSDWTHDLAAVMPAAPAFVMQPKVRSVADVATLDATISALEHKHGIAPGSTRIIALMTETPQMLLALPTVTSLPKRVAALTWGGEDLSAALGASTHHDAAGNWIATYQLARSLTLVAARACGVLAIDTLHADFRDLEGLETVAGEARRDGFDGMMAIHPAQVPVINDAFTPSEEELAHARRVVAAFDAAPEAGVVQLDGRMLDRPHLANAQRLLQNGQNQG
ncbi:MAG: CoA ester lyase [Pseudomonadota bacterium]